MPAQNEVSGLTRALLGLMVLGTVLAAPVQAGSSDALLQKVRAFRVAHEPEILRELVQFLAIPNVASDHPNIRRNADAIALMLERRGLKPQVLQLSGMPDVPPLVYGEWRVPGAKRTLILYAHYDGQPVNEAEWTTAPWTPTLRTAPLGDGGSIVALDSPQAVSPEMRLYARSSGDDKAGVMVILSALDALRAAKRHPTDNVKIVFEVRRGSGLASPGTTSGGTSCAVRFADVGHLRWSRQRIRACASHVRGSRRPECRPDGGRGRCGHCTVDITANWAPNPALRLARLLASMKDDKGHVVIPGWYDGVEPLGQLERQALADATEDDASLRRELGIAAPESDSSLPEAITQPSLNINGMRSANVGAQATNVIPDTATAVLDLRLVLGNDPAQQVDRLRAHVRSQGYYVIDHAPTLQERLDHPLVATLIVRPGVYASARMPMNDPFAREVVAGARTATSRPILELPTSGGSLPLSVIKVALGTPSIVVSIANHDDNQHTANENLRLGNLWDGIDVYAALLAH